MNDTGYERYAGNVLRDTDDEYRICQVYVFRSKKDVVITMMDLDKCKDTYRMSTALAKSIADALNETVEEIEKNRKD